MFHEIGNGKMGIRAPVGGQYLIVINYLYMPNHVYASPWNIIALAGYMNPMPHSYPVQFAPFQV